MLWGKISRLTCMLAYFIPYIYIYTNFITSVSLSKEWLSFLKSLHVRLCSRTGIRHKREPVTEAKQQNKNTNIVLVGHVHYLHIHHAAWHHQQWFSIVEPTSFIRRLCDVVTTVSGNYLKNKGSLMVSLVPWRNSCYISIAQRIL